jgi:hypothetical protein
MLDFIDNIVGDKKIPKENKDDLELYKLNKRGAYLHLLNFVSQIGLYHYLESTDKNNYNLRINENVDGLQKFPEAIDSTNKLSETIKNNFINLTRGEKTKYLIPLGIIVGAFSYMSFLAHLSLLILGGRYYSWIKYYKINFVRWLEYAISSPTMMIVIATLSGVQNNHQVSSIFTAAMVTNLFGLMSEITKGTEYNNLSRLFFILGFLPFRSSWNPIIKTFKSRFDYIGDGNKNSGFKKDYEKIYGEDKYKESFPKGLEIPEWVRNSIYILYGFYYLFPLNMSLQRFILPKLIPKKKNFLGINLKNKDPYILGEKGFIYLSFISKATLSWILFSGIARDQESTYFEGDYTLSTDSAFEIKPWHFYIGLGGLTAGSIYFAKKYSANADEEIKPKKLEEERYFKRYLKNKNIEDLSDDEVVELDKLLTIIKKKKLKIKI